MDLAKLLAGCALLGALCVTSFSSAGCAFEDSTDEPARILGAPAAAPSDDGASLKAEHPGAKEDDSWTTGEIVVLVIVLLIVLIILIRIGAGGAVIDAASDVDFGGDD